MNAIAIWKSFEQLFPGNAKNVTSFTEHGENSIILYFKNNSNNALKFTIDAPSKRWRLEPYCNKF